ncbi:DNA primase/helicase protein [Rhizobium phage RHph_N3_13]|nr:DNA primase/helicase protein [Rhizobium phage RHph_N3_13]
MTWIKTGQPCPCGKSSDAYAINNKEDGHCFSCGKHFFKDKILEEEDMDTGSYTLETFEHRGLRKSTLEKFRVQTKFFEGEPLETAFFYPNGAIKVRNMVEGKEGRTFRTQGDFSHTHLFGKNVFDKGSKRVITITEGEYDALSVAQMIGEETAAVSIRGASSAKADCTAEYEYLNSFDKIVICFDNDEPGQTAARKVASLFDFRKVYNLSLTLHKDANEYLKNDLQKEFYQAWSGAKRYTPDSILSTKSEFREALKSKREEKLANYPFQQLQNMLFGIHRGEVIVIKAPEGVGKSELFRAIENHILKTTKHPIGLIHLEEDNGTTLRALAGYFSETAVLHPENPTDDETVLKIIEEIMGEDENRFVLHSSFDVEDEDQFIDNVRFMVAACGAQVIFFDHISWLATGSPEKGDDERKRLDRISQRLKLLAKELGFALIMISHVNDDGLTRGSRNISKVANTVISISRDKTSTDPVERLKTHILVEKARLIGSKEGPAGYAIYNEEKLMLVDPSDIQLELPK